MDLKRSIESGIDAEIQWGKHYRAEKRKAQRPSIVPTSSPLNVRQMWVKYQVTRQLQELERLKNQIVAKPLPKSLELSKNKLCKTDRAAFNKKDYIDFLATPKKRVELRDNTIEPVQALRKKLRTDGCSPRLIQLARPKKVRIVGAWKDFGQYLSIEFINRLDELLRTDNTLDPKFARCCFKELDRKRRQQLSKQLKKRRRQKRCKKRNSERWLKQQIKTTADLIISFLQQEPLLKLNFKQMLLSNIILVKLVAKKEIKFKPLRNSSNPYKQAIVDVVDQLSVWMDTIVRYVDIQYVESEEIIAGISVESIFSEEEEEEGEEGEEEVIKRFSLPPLPKLPAMEPLALLSGYGEGEGYTSSYTGSVFENILQEMGDSEALGDIGDLGEDDPLAILISVLSSSPDDVLQQTITADNIPEVTYQDILIRLKKLRDQEEITQKKARQKALEDIMLEWAKNNDPDKVNDRVVSKIQDTAGILAECLRKEYQDTLMLSEGLEGILPEDTSISLAITESALAPISGAGEGEGESLLKALSGAEISSAEISGPEISSAEKSGTEISGPEISEAEPIEEVIEEPSEVTELGEESGRKALDTLTEEGGGFGTEDEVSELKSVGMAEESVEAPLTALKAEADLEFVIKREKEIKVEVTGYDEEVELEELKVPIPAEPGELVTLPGEGEEVELEEIMGIRRDIPEIIARHDPSKVFEHAPGTICCLTLKVWATWLLEVAGNAHAWSRWLNEIINEVRRIASIIRGEVKDAQGNPVMFYKEDWLEFSEKVDKMIVSWRQYSMHVKDLTDKIIRNFHNKKITCCPKCLEDNLIVNIPVAHDISEQLAEAMNTANYWRRWLDSIVMETKRLTSAAMESADRESEGSSYEGMKVIELLEPGSSDSEESIYEIEEVDPDNY